MKEPTDIQKFKMELKYLLNKYNASICWNYSNDSDTHGIYEDWMSITVDGKEERIANGSSIDLVDIKAESQEDELKKQYR